MILSRYIFYMELVKMDEEKKTKKWSWVVQGGWGDLKSLLDITQVWSDFVH